MRLSELGRKYTVSFMWLFLAAFCLPAGRAAEQPSHFEQANRLYEQGKFAEAASLYESMLKAGRNSAPVYFNLGNAYFRDGNLGRALYSYLMAQRLAPRDPDIQANLRFTRDRVPASVSATPPLWKKLLQYFSVNELSLFSVLLFWLWAALYCVTRLNGAWKPRFRVAMTVLGALFLLSLLPLLLSFAASRERLAIATAPQVTVHLGPLAESQAAYTVSGGSELIMLGQRDEWIQVRDQTHRSGWVNLTNVLIFPPPATR